MEMHLHEAAIPACIVQAAQDYSLPLRGLLAVLLTEGGREGSIIRNKNGTADHGPFQINTVWAREFAMKYGITAPMLTHDFCLSAKAGAYVLRYEINRAGGSFWDGVGHYHSRTKIHKERYIRAVYKNSTRF